MVFIFVASITKLEGTGMVVVTEVVTGLDVVAVDMVVVAAGVDVVAADMVVVAEVVTGLEVVAVLDVTRTLVAGVGDAISPATQHQITLSIKDDISFSATYLLTSVVC